MWARNYPSHKPECFFDSTDFKNLPLSKRCYKKSRRIVESFGLEKSSRSSSPNVGLAQIFSLFSSKCGVQPFRCVGLSRRTSPGHFSMHWWGKKINFPPKNYFWTKASPRKEPHLTESIPKCWKQQVWERKQRSLGTRERQHKRHNAKIQMVTSEKFSKSR